MASTVSKSSDSHTATVAQERTRLHNLGAHVRTVVSLLAVYAPPALVLLLDRGLVAKLYLIIGIWAIEGIAWYWLKNHVIDRGDRRTGTSWRPDYN
jgi:hypothetical protein